MSRAVYRDDEAALLETRARLLAERASEARRARAISVGSSARAHELARAALAQLGTSGLDEGPAGMVGGYAGTQAPSDRWNGACVRCSVEERDGTSWHIPSRAGLRERRRM
jgi:hypothetical protein